MSIGGTRNTISVLLISFSFLFRRFLCWPIHTSVSVFSSMLFSRLTFDLFRYGKPAFTQCERYFCCAFVWEASKIIWKFVWAAIPSLSCFLYDYVLCMLMSLDIIRWAYFTFSACRISLCVLLLLLASFSPFHSCILSLPSCLTSSSPFQYTFDWIWIAYVEQIFFCFVFVLMLIFCECVFQHSAARWAVFRFSSFDMCARLSRTRKLWNLIFFLVKKHSFFHSLFGDKQWKLLQYSQGE